MAFSLALGAAIGAVAVELAAQVAARLLGGLGMGSPDWRIWSGFLQPLGWALGCFVAFISYMSYRMDNNADT